METVPALQVELPTTSATSNLDPSVGEECQKADLDMAVGENARSLDPKVARILLEVAATTWEVLPPASRVPCYSENTVTQKRSSHV
jgi:hypothetical protein